MCLVQSILNGDPKHGGEDLMASASAFPGGPRPRFPILWSEAACQVSRIAVFHWKRFNDLAIVITILCLISFVITFFIHRARNRDHLGVEEFVGGMILNDGPKAIEIVKQWRVRHCRH